MTKREHLVNRMLNHYKTRMVTAQEISLTYKGLKLLMITEDGCYDFFLADDVSPYRYMFGLPVEQQTDTEAIEIAISNIPDYYEHFTEV